MASKARSKKLEERDVSLDSIQSGKQKNGTVDLQYQSEEQEETPSTTKGYAYLCLVSSLVKMDRRTDVRGRSLSDFENPRART